MRYRLSLFALLTSLAVLAVAGTASPASKASKAQAVAAGWDCSPDIIIPAIGGYFHCAPPGSPSLLDLITGAASPPNLHLNVYYDGLTPQTQLLAGTERLVRADLFRGQPCPQEGGSWGPLDFYGSAAPEYYGCHHFAA